jgi:hypothetical protein
MHSPAEGAGPIAAAAVWLLAEKASDIKVSRIEFSAPKYDWRQHQSRLPPGSEILFREPTPWKRYPWEIALTIGVILVQGGLISQPC